MALTIPMMTNYLTHCSPEAPKRKMSDAPADKANKHVHKKVQETNSAGVSGSNETTNHAAGPPEQGILRFHL